MATTQVIDLLLQDGSDYESTVGIVGILYATVAAHAGAARDGSNLTGPLSNVAATMFTKVVVWTPHCRTPLRRSRQLALSARV